MVAFSEIASAIGIGRDFVDENISVNTNFK
jgi:hypothetical protein